MNANEVFGTYHPVINFIFYILAMAFGMLILHPIYQIGSLVLASAFYLTVKRDGWKLFAGMIPLFLGLSFLNPFFNNTGQTVLFTYMNGRIYTWEALLYGMSLGVMFVTVIIWFASYNVIMTSDKFLYCFGKLAPSVSLILTMVLRFVPLYQKKAAQVSNARKCIGKTVSDGTNKEKVEQGMVIISSLTSWALEGGIMTSDSMQSRGYGCGKRTCFSIYRWRRKETILLSIMAACGVVLVICMFCGGTYRQFVPYIEIANMDNPYTLAGFISYLVLLSIPTILNLMEKILWRILKSKI